MHGSCLNVQALYRHRKQKANSCLRPACYVYNVAVLVPARVITRAVKRETPRCRAILKVRLAKVCCPRNGKQASPRCGDWLSRTPLRLAAQEGEAV
jgi:hypothetical protein